MYKHVYQGKATYEFPLHEECGSCNYSVLDSIHNNSAVVSIWAAFHEFKLFCKSA